MLLVFSKHHYSYLTKFQDLNFSTYLSFFPVPFSQFFKCPVDVLCYEHGLTALFIYCFWQISIRNQFKINLIRHFVNQVIFIKARARPATPRGRAGGHDPHFFYVAKMVADNNFQKLFRQPHRVYNNSFGGILKCIWSEIADFVPCFLDPLSLFLSRLSKIFKSHSLALNMKNA